MPQFLPYPQLLSGEELSEGRMCLKFIAQDLASVKKEQQHRSGASIHSLQTISEIPKV